jgi:2-dehydro-3-deoxyphosphogluconate aldolase/(4S)-4-hydroxy-2-oxoglutarate aldolase
MRRQDVVGAIEDVGVVAVIRLKEPDKLHSVIDALAEGGVRALEVTMTVPRAIELIAELAPRLPPGFQIGAGTVIDAETARLAIMAGATFVVGPVLKPDVITTCHRYDVAVMPGCFTPTEILTAWEHGADVVKVFPATSLGPGFFKDLRGPLPQIKMMPTGGVTIENAGAWIKAGAISVGAGTALLDAAAIEAGDFRVIAERARLIVARVSAARKG